jgi:hypothetical protein
LKALWRSSWFSRYQTDRTARILSEKPLARPQNFRRHDQESPFWSLSTAVDWNILGKIGFECISAHAEGFLKAVGRKPSGEGAICRLLENATTSMSRFDGNGLCPKTPGSYRIMAKGKWHRIA